MAFSMCDIMFKRVSFVETPFLNDSQLKAVSLYPEDQTKPCLGVELPNLT